MKISHLRWTGYFCAAFLFCFLTTLAAATDSPVVPPDSSPFGKPFRQWTAEWWQKVSSIPAPFNPLLDNTGEDCMVGQNGKVWFLYGTFGGPKVNRKCQVPEGSYLFFPIINSSFYNSPNACGQGPDDYSVAFMRNATGGFIDGATDMRVVLDGRSVGAFTASPRNFRVRSAVFAVALPKKNLFVEPCAGQVPPEQPAGIFSPSVDDGYYVMLKPLPIGNHVLKFAAKRPSDEPGADPFVIDITYRLEVVPVSTR